MPEHKLPAYLNAARPTTAAERGPWYATIAPSFAGVMLTIMYYETLGRALPLGGLLAGLVGVALAAVASERLLFRAFGLMGQQSGLPLYVVGSSTFGVRGGWAIPGLFMGLLQVGWYSVSTYITTRLIVMALGQPPLTPFGPDPALRGFSPLFAGVALVAGVSLAVVGALGIRTVAKVGQVAPAIPLVMLVIAAVSAAPGLLDAPAAGPAPVAGALLVVQLTIGYFATAGVAGVDFGMNARTPRDVRLGGLVGILIPILIAAGLTLVTVAGARGLDPALGDFTFSAALRVASPRLAAVMFLLFAISNIPPTCFCAFVMGNAFSTMIPRVPRLVWTLGGAAVGIVLTVLGVAGNLEPFFGLIGASFGPVAGAMTADWLLAGRRWAGPRRGISLPGYAAWVVGFLVGIANNELLAGLLGREILATWHPTGVYSFVVGFAVYALLARLGLEPGRDERFRLEELRDDAG